MCVCKSGADDDGDDGDDDDENKMPRRPTALSAVRRQGLAHSSTCRRRLPHGLLTRSTLNPKLSQTKVYYITANACAYTRVLCALQS